MAFNTPLGGVQQNNGDVGNGLSSFYNGLYGPMWQGLFGDTVSGFMPQGASIFSGTNQQQIDKSYNQSQAGLEQQQQFLSALQQQGGIGNQTAVFNQQQQLAGQLAQQAAGQGPNPAQNQLAQNTAANTANQAALMAGQRGTGANAGLIARQAAQQGAQNQQQMAGQAATLQAQQQLASQQQLGQQQANMQNVASSQVGQVANAQNAYNQASQNQEQQLLNANAGYNNAAVSQQNALNNTAMQASQNTASGNRGLIGGILGGVSSALGMGGSKSGGGLFAHGGEVQGYADGGQVGIGGTPTMTDWLNGPAQQQSTLLAEPQNSPMANSMQKEQSGGGGGLGSLVSLAAMLHKGGPVGKKTPVDSIKNDTVPAMLSPKEIVLPRSVTLSANAPDKAKRFVEAVLAKNGRR